LLQTNNELREEMHEGVTARRRKDLNDSAKGGTLYALGVNAAYTTATAARHVALEAIRWRARTLESKDKEIIPDDIGLVTTAEVTYPIPPEQRTDEQVKALVFRWKTSTVPRRGRQGAAALQRNRDGRRQTDSKDQPWMVTTKVASGIWHPAANPPRPPPPLLAAGKLLTALLGERLRSSQLAALAPS
jgi:hypothetical protein